MPSQARAVLFDLYGTLADVHSVSSLAEDLFPRHGSRLSVLWRQKQLEYTHLHTLAGRYKPFREITRDALQYALARLGMACPPEAEAALMDRYGRLTPYPEVRGVLERLRAWGVRAGVLSNGDPDMIATLTQNAGFANLLDPLLSVAPVQKYKTHPDAYSLGTTALGLAPQEILFVSSNSWDAVGATWFGYETLWVNRCNLPPEALGAQPTHTGRSLLDVLSLVD
ncbi:MAG: haloacid dehalogenase type II [Chromatiales bacterium]